MTKTECRYACAAFPHCGCNVEALNPPMATEAERIAALLPFAHTGGYREACAIVRDQLAKSGARIDPRLFEDIVAALMKRSRDALSTTSDQFKRAAKRRRRQMRLDKRFKMHAPTKSAIAAPGMAKKPATPAKRAR